MKRIILFSFLFLFSLISFGQKVRFCDSTNHWAMRYAYDYPIVWYPCSNSYTGSVMIGGLKYLYLTGIGTGTNSGWIREDTILKKVFVRSFSIGGSFDTTEQVLYDYNWQIGDTVMHTETYTYVHVVTSLDSTLINSVWHKVWHFAGVSGFDPGSYDVVEGVGCLNDPLFPLFPINFESATQLLCYSNASMGTPAVAPAVEGYFDNLTSCTLGIDLLNIHGKAGVIPNPIDKTSYIALPDIITEGTICIIDAIGSKVMEANFENKGQILIGDKVETTGLYFYKVTDRNSGKTYSGKFIFY